MAGDIFYNKVSLLLPMTGSNGSTTFTDYSPSVKTVTANGNAQISTAIDAGGTGLFDGSGDYLLCADSGARLSSGNHTVELFFYPTAYPASSGGLWTQYYSTGTPAGRSSLWYNNTGNVGLQIGSSTVTSVSALALNNWHHVAFVRLDDICTLYINGISVGSFSNSTTIVNTSVRAGAYNNGTDGTPSMGNYFTGHIRYLRINKTIARYTADFTPPSPPLPTYLEPRALELYAVNQPIVQAFNPTIFNG